MLKSFYTNSEKQLNCFYLVSQIVECIRRKPVRTFISDFLLAQTRNLAVKAILCSLLLSWSKEILYILMFPQFHTTH